MRKLRWTMACAALVGAIAGLPATVVADELQGTVTAGVGHTSNAGLASQDPEGSNLAELGLLLGWKALTARGTSDVRADVTEIDYLGKRYGSEFNGALDARLGATLVPEALKWVFDDGLGTSRRDLQQAAGPENRETVNYVATGPDGMVTLSSANRLRLGARYARFDYQTSPRDNERYSGELSVSHMLDSGLEASLNGRDEHVRYSKAQLQAADYDLQRLFLALGSGKEQEHWRVALGGSRADLRSGSQSGLYAEASFGRRVGARSSLTLDGGRQVTDAGGAFAQQRLLGTSLSSETLSIATAATTFDSTYARAGWDIAGRVTRLGVVGGWFNETYRSEPASDRQRWQGELHAMRQLGVRLTASSLLTYAFDNFRNVQGDAREFTGRIDLSWTLGSRLALVGSVERLRRTSELAQGDVDEDRVWLRLRFGAAMVRGVGAFGALP